MFLSPLHALRARARLALDDALGIAAQGRQRGVGAAQLERLAAEIPLIAGPAGHVALGMGIGKVWDGQKEGSKTLRNENSGEKPRWSMSCCCICKSPRA